MMELLRSWLIGITCAAVIAALCESLTPPGGVRRVGRLAGGLLLMIAILRPVVGTDLAALSGALADYRARAAGYESELKIANTNLLKTIIAEQTSAYIQDKAESLGIACTVTVVCEYGGGEFPIPTSVTVTGDMTDEEQMAISRAIEGDFAIPAAQQNFVRNDNET